MFTLLLMSSFSIGYIKDMFFVTARTVSSKLKKNQRNECNFSKIVMPVLKIGMILAFIIVYPVNISLKNFFSTLRENGPCRFKLISSSKRYSELLLDLVCIV